MDYTLDSPPSSPLSNRPDSRENQSQETILDYDAKCSGSDPQLLDHIAHSRGALESMPSVAESNADEVFVVTEYTQENKSITAADFRRFSNRKIKPVRYGNMQVGDLNTEGQKILSGVTNVKAHRIKKQKFRIQKRLSKGNGCHEPPSGRISKDSAVFVNEKTETLGDLDLNERAILTAASIPYLQSYVKSAMNDMVQVSINDASHPSCQKPTAFVGPLPLSQEEYSVLARCSDIIMQKTEISMKPEPVGLPRVWATDRQALCETILYYQAYQGACYISNGVLRAFMFDSNGHERDLIDEDVIIARAGGGMLKDKVSNEMYQAKDQMENNQTQAVKAAIVAQNPIVVFCGSENADVPTKMPQRYCCLDWFKVTHIWSERVQRRSGGSGVVIKYRFEKLNSCETSWWAARSNNASETVVPKIGNLGPVITFECWACRKLSPQVYLGGWMCLHSNCFNFWIKPDGNEPEVLKYDPRFVKQKTAWLQETPPHDVRPELPEPLMMVGEDTTFAMTRGMCCSRCGRCTSRYLWKGWRCGNVECGYDYTPQHLLIPAVRLRDPWHVTSISYAQSLDFHDTFHVKVDVIMDHNYRINRYTFAGIDGCIIHMIANRTVKEEALGPDLMFEELQQADCGLERRRFKTGSEDFMTAFSNNRGMPYKFVASAESLSFEGSPWPLTETRSRLTWAARRLIGPDVSFNELLTIGYFQQQNMKYHDDGEFGLGPTVASLSLGYSADMYFRIKGKHWCGTSPSGVFTDTIPLPGTLRYNERMERYLELIEQNDGSNKASRLRDASTKLGLTWNVKDRKPWLRLRLCHGDNVIMHGNQIQEYFEHQVDSLGSLRFALTCRNILPGHLKTDELPSYNVLPDDGHYNGSRIADLK